MWSCMSSSMPSAVTVRSSACPSPTMAATIARVVLARAEAGDQRAVDLQRVDRQHVQVRERRLAGAEVVDADAHAARRQLAAARRSRSPRFSTSTRLVDLERQQRRDRGASR